MRRLKHLFASFIVTASCLTSSAQEYEDGSKNGNLTIRLESAGTFTDGDYAPFWITSNNYGIGSENTGNAYLRVGAFGGKSIFNNQLDIRLGLDVLASYNLHSNFYFQQLYADFRYKVLGLSVGSKERHDPLKNKDLSSGQLTLSDNARPIPQVMAGFPEFVEIPYTNGWVHVKGAVSYGWFMDDKYKKRHAADRNYAEDILYHRKYLYLNFEKSSPWSFIIGMQMDTQWGGKFYKNGVFTYDSPGNFKNFLKVLVPMSGGEETNEVDQVNIVGNVYGNWDFILSYKKEHYSVKLYHEHFFEDHSGIIFKNMPDGLYGLEFNLNRKAPVSSLLFEYLHTKSQSGPFLWDETPAIPIQVSGGDNYYNHGDYISLTNYGFTLGNPLLLSAIYNDGKTLSLLNTRITSFHGGIGGYVTQELKYRLLLTYSRSWGTVHRPSLHIRNQFSGMLEMTYSNPKLPGWLFTGALAYDDAATMVGDNLGVRIKLAKTFHVK